MKILDRAGVLEIPKEDLPLIVLSDNMYSLFSLGIKSHTKGSYSHVMIMVEPGYFVTQNWTLKKVPCAKYLNGRYRLKFVGGDWSKLRKLWVFGGVVYDVENKSSRYDWLGILGQLLNIRRLNFKNRNYCSEYVGRYLKMLDPEFSMVHPSPSDINRWTKESGRNWVYGVYDEGL